MMRQVGVHRERRVNEETRRLGRVASIFFAVGGRPLTVGTSVMRNIEDYGPRESQKDGE